MKAKEIRQQIERQLIGKLPTALNSLSAVEELLPHWDQLGLEACEKHTVALQEARSTLHDLIDAMSDSAEEGEES